MNQAHTDIATFLFTDIEGSTRMWEQDAERMNAALAAHDALVQRCVTAHDGRVVKSTGDGVHAVFDDPLDGVQAALDLQLGLGNPEATAGVPLRVRCGLHAGVNKRRGDDFYGSAVNRAARIMSVAHGGQVLLSSAVRVLVHDRLPAGVSLRELGLVRLRDLTEPEHVYQLACSGLREQFPALRSLESTPNNLPQQLTDFIGREHEVEEVRRQLGTVRLLTIVGTGGLGKSRLALQVAAEVLDDYPDGVWLVELASLSEPRLVPQAVASVLGIKEDADQALLDTLLALTRDRRLLLILDNCEHLALACAELARRLLERSSHLAILATSRERLAIAGERAYPLAPFAVPLPSTRLTPEALLQFASVRLFVTRATAAQPDFALTAQNAIPVAEICHRLDGIPLALELAAARVRAMPVDKVAGRLHDRFRLLTGADRTALPRQKTLRALIDWSHDLLADDEKAAFRRLAAFPGDFTLDAAEALAPEADAFAMLDLVGQLVDKSLLQFDGERNRYRMLETVRQYARDKLDEHGEATDVCRRYIAHYLALVEGAAPTLRGQGRAAAVAMLDDEFENIAAAHAFCVRVPGAGPLDLRLLRAMRTYALTRGLLAVYVGAMADALAHPENQARDIARSRALSDLGQFQLRLGRHAESLRHLNESLEIARELRDDERVAITLQPLGLAYLNSGELELARRCFEEALPLAEASGNRREVMTALSTLAQLERALGNPVAAEAHAERCLAVAREISDPEGLAVSLINLAMIQSMRDELARTLVLLAEAAPRVTDLASRLIAPSFFDAVAGAAALAGEPRLAALFYGHAEAELALSGQTRDRADDTFMSARLATSRAALNAADFAHAEREGRESSLEQALAVASVWLAGRPRARAAGDSG